jgi:hypothetical protein
MMDRGRLTPTYPAVVLARARATCGSASTRLEPPPTVWQGWPGPAPQAGHGPSIPVAVVLGLYRSAVAQGTHRAE